MDLKALRTVWLKVVPFIAATGLVLPMAGAQVTVSGVVTATDPCKLHPYDGERMCAAVILPLQAEVALEQEVRQGRKKVIRSVVLRSAADGHFRRRGIPTGDYAVRLRALQYGEQKFVASDYVTLPARVKISVRSRTHRNGLLVDFVIQHKGASPGKVSQATGSKDTVTTAEGREVIGDCGAVEIPA